MNLLLFLIIIIISFIVVRIGAIAFELTGLERSLAKFQALSCFTGTGFTTREAELITGNPQRRRIASILMVLGNAGLVTLIATFANSLRPSALLNKITIPFLDVNLPPVLVWWIKFIILISAVFAIYKIFTHSRLMRKLTNILRKRIIKRDIIKPVSFEELLVATGGYGISTIDVCPESHIVNKKIRDTDIRRQDVTILAIERKGDVLPNPPADFTIKNNDKLICFGKLDTIRDKVCAVSTS